MRETALIVTWARTAGVGGALGHADRRRAVASSDPTGNDVSVRVCRSSDPYGERDGRLTLDWNKSVVLDDQFASLHAHGLQTFPFNSRRAWCGAAEARAASNAFSLGVHFPSQTPNGLKSSLGRAPLQRCLGGAARILDCRPFAPKPSDFASSERRAE